MDGEIALQISRDDKMGKFLVISSQDMSPDDIVVLGRFLGVIE